MLLGLVGALIEFVGYKVTLRSYFLTVSLFLGRLLETPIFESGNKAEGVMGMMTSWLSCYSCKFFIGSPPFFVTALFTIRQQTNGFCSPCIQASSIFLSSTVISNQITAGKSTLTLLCVLPECFLAFFLHKIIRIKTKEDLLILSFHLLWPVLWHCPERWQISFITPG